MTRPPRPRLPEAVRAVAAADRPWRDAVAGAVAAAAVRIARTEGRDPDAAATLVDVDGVDRDELWPWITTWRALRDAVHETRAWIPCPGQGARPIRRSPRKAAGAWSTPAALAVPLVAAALDPLLPGCRHGGSRQELPRVCDPAAGDGGLLVAAHRRLARHLRRTTGHSAAACRLQAAAAVVGIERDPLAARLARLALWLEHGDVDLAAAGVRDGDALLGFQPGIPPHVLPGADDATPDRAACDLEVARRAFGVEGAASMAERRGGTTEVERLARLHGFLHWHLDVGWCDAVVANPPWDTLKAVRAAAANGRSADAPEALERPLPPVEAMRAWIRASDRFLPRIDGSDPNLYQVFVETAVRAVRPRGGRVALLVPAGLHADHGCAPLRRMLLETTSWERLDGFENRRRLFAIDSRFKFDLVVASTAADACAGDRPPRTAAVAARFALTAPAAARQAGSPPATGITPDQLLRWSPSSLAFCEPRDAVDRTFLDQVHGHGFRIRDDRADGWRIHTTRELDMTRDAQRFVHVEDAEARGFAPAGDGRGAWRCAASDEELYPLWEGRMLGLDDPAKRAFVSGSGRSAEWTTDRAGVRPQWLVPRAACRPRALDEKIGVMAVSSCTNTRTVVAALLREAPCGNSVQTVRTRTDDPDDLVRLQCVLGSLPFDRAVRLRLGGNNLNRFVLSDCPLPDPARLRAVPQLVPAARALDRGGTPSAAAPTPRPGRTERTALRAAVDAVVAVLWDLDEGSIDRLSSDDRGDLRGFWRVDQDLPARDRLPARVRRDARRLIGTPADRRRQACGALLAERLAPWRAAAGRGRAAVATAAGRRDRVGTG